MKFIKNKDVLSREESEGFSLFNPENGELHKLNKHAFFFFNILENPLTFEEIESEIKSKFLFEDEKQLHQLIVNILEDLKSKNLISEI